MARKKSRSKKSRARKSGSAKKSAESPPAEAPEAVDPSSESEASGEEAPVKAKKRSKKKGAAKKEASKKEAIDSEATEKGPDAEESQEAEKRADPGASKKKRKGRKKKTPKKAEKEASTEEEAPPEETVEPSADDGVALDDEDDLSVEDLVAATVALDDGVEAIPIDVDEDDGDARARLIAETLALVAQEESDAVQASGILELADELRRAGSSAGDTADPAAAGSAEEDDGTDGSEPGSADAEAPTGSVDEEAQPPRAQPAPAATADAEYGKAGVDRAASSTEAADAADEARPLIGPQALLALSEIHAEGLARLPDEFILDLGEASTPQERDRLLAAALAHAEMQEAIYRVPTGSTTVRRIKLGIAAVVALLALFAAARPPALLVPEGPASLTMADRDRGVRVALLLQAQQIEAHRVRTGTLPRTLDEVPARLPGIRYVRSSGRSFQLVAYTSQGEPIVFDSAAPGPEFDDVGGLWSSRMEAS